MPTRLRAGRGKPKGTNITQAVNNGQSALQEVLLKMKWEKTREGRNY